MSLDLTHDTTALAATMLRNDRESVPFTFPPDSGIDPTTWLCQVRRTRNSEDIAKTWTFTEGSWDDLTSQQQTEAVDAGADADTWLVWFLDVNAVDLEGVYVFDVEDTATSNTVMGPYPLEVGGDVTQPESS